MWPAFALWFQAFALTQLVEVPIYRRALGGRTWVAFGASTLTHPVVWFAFPLLPGLTYWWQVGLAEVFAVGVEALYLGAFRLPRALWWSLLANGASLSVGLACRALFGRP